MSANIPVGVAVEARRGAVGSPAGVCDTSVRIEDLGQIGLGLLNQLLELDHLANLLVSKHLVLLVSVDSESGRVIATVFKAGESCGGDTIQYWELSGHGQAVRRGRNRNSPLTRVSRMYFLSLSTR